MMTYSHFPLTVNDRLFAAIRSAHYRVAETLAACGQPNGKGDYLDIASDGQVSWRPLNRIERDAFGVAVEPYNTKGRMRAKPAKAIRSFLSSYGLERLSDRDWEIFSNRFLAQNTESRLELVEGKTIKDLYLWSAATTKKRVPALSSSCMRYDWCQPFLDLYANNPKQCKMLVKLDDQNDVEARALVWYTDSGDVLMDRVYGDNNDVEAFRKYAEDKNWMYRTYNSYTYPSSMMVEGTSRRRSRKVTLDHVPEYFPFCDTMLWLARGEGVLANSKTALRGMNDIIKLRSTRGDYSR